MPHFHGENLAEFRVWCVMAYRQGFMLVYTTYVSVFVLGQAKALQSIEPVDARRIHGEIDVTKLTWIETITPR